MELFQALVDTLCWCQYPGGYDGGYRDEILEFRPDTEEWSLAGRMMEDRDHHAVSNINFEDVREWCKI